jgi:translation initiation factor eIF-2B subunit epsilon
MPQKLNADTTVTHPLQAVVLADSFTRTFRPMSLEKPKVLLPLANSPMIEYTLEMLANAKVKEIIVVCCWHAPQVAEYVKQSRWGSSKNPLVRVVSFPKADSAGTALRELADTSLIQSDPFILISGDVVSNVRLGPILRAHMAREDKNKIMTMVFRKTNPGNPLRNFDDDLVVAMNAETKQLLLYEVDEGEPDEDNEGEISLKLGKEARFFIEHPKLEIRHDLLDCHIDICSPEMFDVLQGEFYEDLRLGMVRKEVSSPEFQHNFYVHELTMPQDYAARVHCVRSYDQVSKDVIGRWLYPLTPDNNWSTRDGTCWFTR